MNPTPTNNKKPPKPESTRVYLVSEGIARPTATPHHHVRTQLVLIAPLIKGDPDQMCWEHIYKCFQTGAERRWGLHDGPSVPPAEKKSEGDDENPDAPASGDADAGVEAWGN